MRISDWSSDVCSSDLLGFRCDTSVRSGFDYRAGHGPDYREAPLHPWWVKLGQGAVLEMPVTTVFGGLLGPAGRWLYHRTASNSHPALARLGPADWLARSGGDSCRGSGCRHV